MDRKRKEQVRREIDLRERISMKYRSERNFFEVVWTREAYEGGADNKESV